MNQRETSKPQHAEVICKVADKLRGRPEVMSVGSRIPSPTEV